MARLIVTVLLFGILVSTAVWENNFIGGAYKSLGREIDAFTAVIQTQEKIDTTQNIAEINRIYNKWLKKERDLSHVIRHFDLVQVSDALIYIKNFVEFDNKEEAFAGIQRLRYLVDAHAYNFSTNVKNVI